MPPEPIERKLAALLSADAVGYSRLMAEDDVATVRTLTAYRDEIRLLVEQHRGRVVDAPGDNLLAELRHRSAGVARTMSPNIRSYASHSRTWSPQQPVP